MNCAKPHSRKKSAARPRLARAADERGAALIMALLVSVVVVGVGALALSVTRSEVRVASNYERGLAAKYHAESGLDRIVGMQNNLNASPRYLFNMGTYTARANPGVNDTSYMYNSNADAPLSGSSQTMGTIDTRVIGKDPITQTPPYLVESTSLMADGSSTTYRAVVDVLSLLDFAVFSDEDIYIAPDITIGGRVYSGEDIVLTGPIATFLQRVEYASSISNTGFGDFRQGHSQVKPLPSIPAIVSLTFFENASKNAGVCSTGRGLYIGQDGPGTVDNQTNNLFRAYEPATGNPAGRNTSSYQPRCRDSNQCAVIDLTLLDFNRTPIEYNGVPLVGFDGTALNNFNGVIWSDEELHVFGHLGGRSVEDMTITDTHNYMVPAGNGPNRYSNNVLDSAEDGANGGSAQGILDPLNVGTSMGIYANNNIWIDHNIFAGFDINGNPVRLALVARNNVRIDGYSPRVINVDAAVLAVNGTWRPRGDQSSHRRNDWADLNGSNAPSAWVYDMDRDGVIETSNGATRSSDRNETDMRFAWTLRNTGNLVVATRPSSAPWTSVSPAHPRFYTYDQTLMTAEIPCYPTLPNYGIVPGSFTEIVRVP